MNSYLVTGGAGFIGSHLIDHLVGKGEHVRVIDDLSTGNRENLSNGVELIEGDITDAETVRRAMRGVKAVVHLAAIASVERSITDWRRSHQVNVGGSVTVLTIAAELQAQKPIPVIYASSAAVYGENLSLPVVENSRLQPMSPYAADKLASELHAQAATLLSAVPTFGLRFFNVYGPRQNPSSPYSGVISIFNDRASRNELLVINGDGEQTRDFVYIYDVVCAIEAALERSLSNPPQAHVVNICTGHATSVKQLADLTRQVWGSDALLKFAPPRLGDIKRSIGDPAAAKALLQFGAHTTLREGLMLMVPQQS